LPALARGSEAKLLDLITNPCEAELVNGYSTTTTGIVQRFNRFITPVAGTETAFAYVFNPCSQTDTGSFASIVQKLAIGGGTPSNLTTAGPGHAFLDAQADNVGCLAACIEVLYTGKLVDRQGYIGVCQLPYNVATDIANGTTDLPTLMAYCQQVSPIPSHAVELKWSPSIRALSANAQVTETASGIDNCLMVVAVGVNPNQFVVKFTTVYEYQPKFALGLPAPRATKTIPIGAPERIVTALDRMGHWWHNLGSAAAAAYRMGGSMVYAANQTARLARGAQAALGPATTLLALTG
jgi:hypothetical protein